MKSWMASGSMGSKLDKSRQAVAQFFKTANPEDEFFLIQFSDRPELVLDFTTHLEEIQNRLTFLKSKGRVRPPRAHSPTVYERAPVRCTYL